MTGNEEGETLCKVRTESTMVEEELKVEGTTNRVKGTKKNWSTTELGREKN